MALKLFMLKMHLKQSNQSHINEAQEEKIKQDNEFILHTCLIKLPKMLHGNIR